MEKNNNSVQLVRDRCARIIAASHGNKRVDIRQAGMGNKGLRDRWRNDDISRDKWRPQDRRG